MHLFFNRFIRKLNYYLHHFWFFINTIFEVFYLKLIGVILRKGIQFRGWSSFFLFNNSKIQIGEKCSFNSSSYTNHIGINHKCLISTMRPNAEIVIGDFTGISGSTITSFASIRIGKDVRIGANCVIMDGDFHLNDSRTSTPKPIIIEDKVWLGANVVVMKGVRIGENSVIGINSVVTKDIPSNCVAAGNPCKIIKQL